MNILIVDCNIDRDKWGSQDLLRYARVPTDGAGTPVFSTVSVRRGPQDDLPGDLNQYDRIVISGSKTSVLENAPWIDHLHEFIRRAVDSGKPLLGVCYGFQALCRALGGAESVRRAAAPELGWTEIELTADDPIFKGLPRKFFTFSSHFEEVCLLPKGFINLARSKDCAIQACRLGQQAVYGVQFHPEKDLRGTAEIFEKWKKSHEKRVRMPGAGKKLYNPRVGAAIFKNFLGATVGATE